MKKISIVFITIDKEKSADKITNVLLKERLAACVNRVKNVNSSYWWNGKIERAIESLLIVKTKKTMVKKLIRRVKKLHPYTVPEIIAFDVKNGNKDYLRWVAEETL
jgi:periplasmic divalent cation tolerance protein